MPLLVALRCSASAPQGAGERSRVLSVLPGGHMSPAQGPAVLELPAADVSCVAWGTSSWFSVAVDRFINSRRRNCILGGAD